MFKHLKSLVFLVLLIILAGCGAKPSVELSPNKKTFDQEDIYILTALRMEQVKFYSKASDFFEILYEKSSKKEYLYRSLKNDLAANKNEKVIQRVDKELQDSIDDYELVRLKVFALIKLDRLEEARKLSVILVESSKKIQDYLLVSEIYVKNKQFDTALKYLESAYVKDYNEKILDKMSIVLYVNLGRKKEAIAQLESHSRINGCSELICARLIGFYSNDNNIDGLLSTYLRLYEMKSTKEIAQKIVQIYGYKKDYTGLISFLEKSRSDDELLFQVYVQIKDYKKAYPLAEKLYKQNGSIHFLGQSAIFEYESAKDKNNKKMLESVIEKLNNVIVVSRDTIYLNYLGYIFIDHEINIKKGMKYIKETLKVEPDSAYYLDSLAWGYYKLGNCKRAKKIINKVAKMKGGDNPEVIEHIKIINNCKKNKPKKNTKIKKGKK